MHYLGLISMQVDLQQLWLLPQVANTGFSSKSQNEDAKCGNMRSPSAFENNWHPAEFQAGAYKYEAVHLTAGTTLSVFLLLFLLLL